VVSTARARVLVCNDHDEVALLERRVLGLRYWEVPGGHVEDGESLAEAAVREIEEELGVDLRATDLRRAGAVRIHHLYTADISGRPELHLSGPEIGRGLPVNRYRPRWVDRRRVPRLLLWPFDVRLAVVRTLRT
jgi:8-oxo-dGTP pyrophosphatase MutT (NUDIX family)